MTKLRLLIVVVNTGKTKRQDHKIRQLHFANYMNVTPEPPFKQAKQAMYNAFDV
jgi:methyl coenzyme M reductase gamma subunit